jgi:hypothetical protein
MARTFPSSLAALVLTLASGCGEPSPAQPVSSSPCTYLVPVDAAGGGELSGLGVHAPALRDASVSLRMREGPALRAPDGSAAMELQLRAGAGEVTVEPFPSGRYWIELRRRDGTAGCGPIDVEVYALRRAAP